MNRTTDHPVQLDVDDTERPLDRVSSAFRLLAIVPALAVTGYASASVTDQYLPFRLRAAVR